MGPPWPGAVRKLPFTGGSWCPGLGASTSAGNPVLSMPHYTYGRSIPTDRPVGLQPGASKRFLSELVGRANFFQRMHPRRTGFLTSLRYAGAVRLASSRKGALRLLRQTRRSAPNYRQIRGDCASYESLGAMMTCDKSRGARQGFTTPRAPARLRPILSGTAMLTEHRNHPSTTVGGRRSTLDRRDGASSDRRESRIGPTIEQSDC